MFDGDARLHGATMTKEEISAFMTEMGRKGGRIGGKRRLETMSAALRSDYACRAARARWGHVCRPWWHEYGATFSIHYPAGPELGVVDHLTRVRVWFRFIGHDSMQERDSRRIPIAEFKQLVRDKVIRRC